MAGAPELITARKHLARIRDIERNIRLRRYNGRNSTATHTTLTLHYGKVAALEHGLPKELRGLIWAEHDLAARVSLNRDAGQDRPELRKRLADIRRDIKANA